MPRSRSPAARYPSIRFEKTRTPSGERDRQETADPLATLAVIVVVLAVWGVDIVAFLTNSAPRAALSLDRLGGNHEGSTADGEVEARGAPYAWPLTALAFMARAADQLVDDHQARDLHCVHSLVLTAIVAFGGGIIGPLLSGRAQVYCVEESFIWMLLFIWTLTHRTGGRWTRLYRATPALEFLCTALAQAFRVHMIINFCKMGDDAFRNCPFTTSRYFDNSSARTLGPILCGALAGSGTPFFLAFPELPFREGVPDVLATGLGAATLYWLPVVRPTVPTPLGQLHLVPQEFQLEARTAKASISMCLIILTVFNDGSPDFRRLVSQHRSKSE